MNSFPRHSEGELAGRAGDLLQDGRDHKSIWSLGTYLRILRLCISKNYRLFCLLFTLVNKLHTDLTAALEILNDWWVTATTRLDTKGRRPSPNSLTLELAHSFDTTPFNWWAGTGWISLGWEKKLLTHKNSALKIVNRVEQTKRCKKTKKNLACMKYLQFKNTAE